MQLLECTHLLAFLKCYHWIVDIVSANSPHSAIANVQTSRDTSHRHILDCSQVFDLLQQRFICLFDLALSFRLLASLSWNQCVRIIL